MIVRRLAALRAEMKQRGIDAYLIPTADFHQSEYVGEYFKCRRYITGFTGSAGTALVMADRAILWTDGRYFIQAAHQLEGSGVELYRMGEEGVPTLKEFLKRELHEGSCLGFDGRVLDARQGEEFERMAGQAGARLSWKEDLVGLIWKDRPEMSCEPVWSFDAAYTGETRAERIGRVREAMKKAGADCHVLTALDDIAWTFNLRGNDVACTPVALANAIITETAAEIFLRSAAVSESLRGELEESGITVREYAEFYAAAADIRADAGILLDKDKVSYFLWETLPREAKRIERKNPSALMKAVKTPTERDNMRLAHLWDGAALTRFIFWVKQNVGRIPMTEYSAAEKLEEFRREQKHFLGNSFETICAYGANAAQCHYSASKENCAAVEPRGFLLCDSGGQYYEGTTDVTRTIAVGPLTEEEKLHFTLVLKGMLKLANARFLYGCRGLNLDYLAREALWERGLDFNHGTGHGVGYLLSVHEGPNGFRWRIVPERDDSCVLEEGMITSDEPGIYIEDSHGIRTENLLLCRKAEKTPYGQFMEFEPLTMAPIDLDAVDETLLDEGDRKRLNEYHRQVYQNLAPLLPEAERNWLKEATRPL